MLQAQHTPNSISSDIRELIVYACPTGPIGEQLDRYFERSARECGRNAAHAYMPHCTLTGFFHDSAQSVRGYCEALSEVQKSLLPSRPNPVITVTRMECSDGFHYLGLESHWIQRLAEEFAIRPSSTTRLDAIRVKDWLHLSLAYNFRPEQHPCLAALAGEIIDPNSPANWALRFYERRPGNDWMLHQEWPLTD